MLFGRAFGCREYVAPGGTTLLRLLFCIGRSLSFKQALLVVGIIMADHQTVLWDICEEGDTEKAISYFDTNEEWLDLDCLCELTVRETFDALYNSIELLS
jgi:hypothetical protein